MRDTRIYLRVLLIILLSNLSCSQKRIESAEVLNGKRLVVFVEERNSNDGIWGGEYGDIVIMDLDTKQKFYITDDYYFDTNPIFSPDGKNVIFQSSRDEDKLTLQIKGIGGPHYIYIFNLESRHLHRIDIIYQKERGQFKSTIENIGWIPGEDSLYFGIRDSKIYKCGANGGESRVIKEFKEITHVYNVSVSRDNQFIFAFNGGIKIKDKGVAFYNYDNDNLMIITRGTDYVRDWMIHSSKFIYASGEDTTFCFYAYDTKNNSSSYLFEFNKGLSLGSKIFQIDKNSFVFLASKRRNNGEVDFNNHLVLFDQIKNKYTFLNKDNKSIDCLSVFIGE